MSGKKEFMPLYSRSPLAAMLIACLVIFHAADGSAISVESQHVAAVRPVGDSIKEHLAPGTKSILYVGAHKIGIVEDFDTAEDMLEKCEQ